MIAGKLVFTEIILKKESKNFLLGESIEGVIYLKALEDVNINYFGYSLIKETRGKLIPGSQAILTKFLLINRKLIKGQIVDLDFKSPPIPIESYKGKNAESFWKFETIIKFNEETRQRVRVESLKKLNLGEYFYPEKYANISFDFNVVANNCKFEISGKNGLLKIDNEKISSYLFWILVAGIFFSFGYKTWLWVIVCAMIGISVYFIYISLGNFIIGGIDLISSKTADDYLVCYFNIHKNWSHVKNITIWYEIHEEVTDNRGTGTGIYNEVLYKSKLCKFKNITQKISAKINLPPGTVPGSLNLGNAKVYAVLKLKAEFNNGIVANYFTDLNIKKSPVKRSPYS
ncbi:MAG: hypothetical protein AAFZ15_18095 [Bacteroidota bacterium]